MKKNYGLTNTEMQIMELLWQGRPCDIPRNYGYFIKRMGKKLESADLKHLSDNPPKNGPGRIGTQRMFQRLPSCMHQRRTHSQLDQKIS